MRIHRDGYIQCRRLTLWIPAENYWRAIHASWFPSEGLEKEIEQLLDVELSGELRFRKLEERDNKVHIQVDSDWVQPTRA